MSYRVTKKSNHTLLRVTEDKITSVIAPSLKAEFSNLKIEGVKKVLLDISAVKYVDSSGLSAFLVGNRLFGFNDEKKDGRFVFFGVNEHVLKLINISQLNRVFIMANSEEDALSLIE